MASDGASAGEGGGKRVTFDLTPAPLPVHTEPTRTQSGASSEGQPPGSIERIFDASITQVPDDFGATATASIVEGRGFPDAGVLDGSVLDGLLLALPERYVDLGPIGSGGMGVVHRVHDRLLDQVLAIKFIRRDLVGHERARRRFLREARITARLQHPGIVSVHDAGELPDGRLWFTMREVRGRTLQAVIDALHRASAEGTWGTTDDGWHLRRLLGAFEQACQAVAYAHDAGVVHRDLKPANIMVGAFGEVLVMDWGIARRLDRQAIESGGGTVDTLEPISEVTRAGAVLGSPAYMAPEQVRGENHRHSPATDVWALGTILHCILFGAPPGRSPRHEPPPAPPELVALAGVARVADPAARPEDAGVFAEELRGWLDGARRRVQALALVERADALTPHIDALWSNARSMREQSEAALRPLAPHAPAAEKIPGWRLEDRARLLEQEAEAAAIEYARILRSALSLAPDLDEARERLATEARGRLREAERRGDRRELARAEAQIRAHGDRAALSWLDGPGAVTLVTDPPGALVEAVRLVERDRRWVRGAREPLGPTPLEGVALGRGRWLLEIDAYGCAPVRYPVLIERGTQWDGQPPGGHAPHPIWLPPLGALDDADRYVPAGWFRAGGDPEAADGLSGRWLWLDGFIARRDPVTVGEYRRFLDGLVEAGRAADAERYAPRHRDADGTSRPIFSLKPDGRRGEAVDASGQVWTDRRPVTHVVLAAARAFAEWEAARTQLPWRLPHDLEWEKMGRGVSGRTLPWGAHFEPTWACCLASHPGEPSCPEVGDFLEDESVYGVRWMAGGVRVWCGSPYWREGPPAGGRATAAPAEPSDFVMVRGGSWAATSAYCRLANRFAGRPDNQLNTLGLRLVRSVPGARLT